MVVMSSAVVDLAAVVAKLAVVDVVAGCADEERTDSPVVVEVVDAPPSLRSRGDEAPSSTLGGEGFPPK